MHINVLSIGSRPPNWLNEGINHYKQRLPNYIKLKFIELKPQHRSRSKSIEFCLEEEGKRLIKAIPSDSYVLALDENGEHWNSKDLAAQMEIALGNRTNLTLMIGGPDGLSDICKDRADKIWSLSSLTFPHMLVRLLLSEQIYRALKIIDSHPYHRD
ncbi:MAG: 23S rRNA (pseudouridine(1915)-N(3))-methyltransferase RlmH [Pseudomonadota bacterium]|nr:23S rRNA (pseudouridine(1915)-N(3))-methyltransferase RlmH [Pseudomonadota bacterium]